MMKIEKAQRIIEVVVAADENRIGPTPFGVVGRRAGSVPGFNCTADHKKLGVTWDAATLDKYLAERDGAGHVDGLCWPEERCRARRPCRVSRNAALSGGTAATKAYFFKAFLKERSVVRRVFTSGNGLMEWRSPLL
jgi:hypothetical protein